VGVLAFTACSGDDDADVVQDATVNSAAATTTTLATPTTTVVSGTTTVPGVERITSRSPLVAGRTYSFRLPNNRNAELVVPSTPSAGWQGDVGFSGFSVTNASADIELGVMVLKDIHAVTSPYVPMSAIQGGTALRGLPEDVVGYIRAMPVSMSPAESVSIAGIPGQSVRIQVGSLPAEARTAGCTEVASRPCLMLFANTAEGMFLVENTVSELVVLQSPDLGRIAVTWDVPSSTATSTVDQLAQTVRSIKFR
jgi:hypothetical protein